MTSKILYHGSSTPNIQELEPRKRWVPGELIERFKGKENVPLAVYATDDPACAAVHSFDWSTSLGFDLFYEDDKIVLVVPEKFKDRLKRKVYIYKILAKGFEKLISTDHTYWYLKAVKVLGVEPFDDVETAIRSFSGGVRYG